MSHLRTTIALAPALLLLSNAAGALALYKDRSAWESALGGLPLLTDTFDADIAAATSITLASGIVSAGINGVQNNEVRSGLYVGSVDTDGGSTGDDRFDRIQWTFPSAVYAFGADFVSAASGEGLLLLGDFTGAGTEILSLDTLLGFPGDGFLGLIADVSFTGFSFESGGRVTTIEDENFGIDNAAWSAARPQPMSEPAVSALLAAGMLAFAGTSRRHRRIAQPHPPLSSSTRMRRWTVQTRARRTAAQSVPAY